MKRLDYEVSKRARRQIIAALDWWMERPPFAPDMLESERAIEAIAGQPGIRSRAQSRCFAEVRRDAIGQSGYWLYDTLGGDRPRFLALWHQSQGREPRL